MNFGRRLLDGAINVVSSQPNAPSPSPSPGPSMPMPTIIPNSGPGWPPPSPTNPISSSPFTPTSPDSPLQASPLGLLSKSRPMANGRDAGTAVDITSPPGRPPGGSNDSTSITRSNFLAQPRPVRANGTNNEVLAGTRNDFSSLTGITASAPSKMSSPPAMPKWQTTSAMLSAKGELLLELLSSEAVLDSRDCEILASGQVEELKRVRSPSRLKFSHKY